MTTLDTYPTNEDSGSELETVPSNPPVSEAPPPVTKQWDPRPTRAELLKVVDTCTVGGFESVRETENMVNGLPGEVMQLLGMALGCLNAAADAIAEGLPRAEQPKNRVELERHRLQWALDLVDPYSQVCIRDRIGGWRSE